MRTKLVITLMVIMATSVLTPGAAMGANGDAGIVARFSHGGMILRMTSDLEFEELWGLVINYCDGSREEIWHRFPSKIEYRARLGATGYNFYADKPMKRVLIKTLPIEATGEQVINFRFTRLRRKCDKPEPPPKLYCSNVQVAPVIYRSWEGEPIEFKSSRHVVRAGLRFPGVDGLAPAREPIFNQRIYRPSVRFDAAEHSWRGTFMSSGIPVGDYERVELVVQDDFGEQAKCRVGKLTVMP